MSVWYRAACIAALSIAATQASAIVIDFDFSSNSPAQMSESFPIPGHAASITVSANVLEDESVVPALVKKIPDSPNAERGLGVLKGAFNDPNEIAAGAVGQLESPTFDLNGFALKSITVARHPKGDLSQPMMFNVLAGVTTLGVFMTSVGNDTTNPDPDTLTVSDPSFGSAGSIITLSPANTVTGTGADSGTAFGLFVTGIELQDVSMEVIPIPATAPLLLGALIGGAFVVRRRRKA